MRLAYVHIGLETYGLEMLSAMLKRDLPQIEQRLFAHIALFWDPSDKEETGRVVDKMYDELLEYQPDIVCFSSFTDTCNSLVMLTERLKAHNPAIITVFGAIHATLREKTLLEEYSKIDYSLIGECELSFPSFMTELLEGRKPGANIDGLIRREKGEILSTPVGPGPSEADALPFPDKTLFEPFMPEVITHYGTMSGRGCPYHCTYCAAPMLRDLQGGKKFLRRRSVENVIDELLVYKDRIQEVTFMDDVFTISMNYLEEFLPVYKEKIGKPFICYSGPNNLNPRKAELLADGGCIRVGIGIQSGSERLRRQVLRRPGSNAKIIEAIDMVKKAGVAVSTDFILGVPYETEEDRQESLKLLLRTRPDLMQLFYLTYYPGLEISERAVKDGHLSGEAFKQIEAGNIQKSYYVGSHLEGKELRQARRLGLMFHLIILFPQWLTAPMARMRVYRLFPWGIHWHQLCYTLNALKRGQRLHLLKRVVRDKLKRLGSKRRSKSKRARLVQLPPRAATARREQV